MILSCKYYYSRKDLLFDDLMNECAYKIMKVRKTLIAHGL